MTAQELIKASLRAIQAIATGETPTDAEMVDGLEALSMMLRYWGTKRTLMHYIEVESHILTASTESYSIGSGGDIDTIRPLKITGGYTRSGSRDTPIEVVSEKKYREISQKSYSGGSVVYVWYNPSWGANERGTIYVYPATADTIYLHCLRPLGEPTGLTETVLFPGEYDDPIKWNLAVRLCPEYGKALTPLLQDLAVSTLDQLIAFNAALQIETINSKILSIGRGYDIDSG